MWTSQKKRNKKKKRKKLYFHTHRALGERHKIIKTAKKKKKTELSGL